MYTGPGWGTHPIVAAKITPPRAAPLCPVQPIEPSHNIMASPGVAANLLLFPYKARLRRSLPYSLSLCNL